MLIRTEIVSNQGARRSILCLGQSVRLKNVYRTRLQVDVKLPIIQT